MPDKITEMFAFVATEADGSEGIPAVRMGNTYYPLVGADLERVDALRPVAQNFADEGVPIKLVKFTGIEVVDILTPDEGAA